VVAKTIEDAVIANFKNLPRTCPNFDRITRKIYGLDDAVNLSELENYAISLPKARRGSSKISERLFFHFIKSYSIEHIMEVGAMDGRHTRRFLNETEAKVHTFEPNISAASHFIDIISNPRLFLNFYGLSSSNGISLFNIVQKHGAEVLPELNGLSSFEKIVQVKTSDTSICSAHCKGDDYIEACGIENESMALWIDVEGHSVDVMDGFQKNIKNASMVCCEVETLDSHSSGATADRIVNILEAAGHKLIYRDFQYYGVFNVVSINLTKYRDEMKNILIPAEEFIDIMKRKYAM